MKSKDPVVLIAEDDPMIRQGLAIRLFQMGYGVLTAADGKAAEKMVDRHHLDAAILDVKLPGEDGFHVCQHIRETGATIPIFMMTGADEGVIRNHLESLTGAAGGTHYLTKPFDAKVLAIMIENSLEHS